MHETEDLLLTVAEVAARFGVSTKTVARWVTAGKLSCIRTPGGHRRFPEATIRRVLEDRRVDLAE
jgi:excisionase family DNA binding protein